MKLYSLKGLILVFAVTCVTADGAPASVLRPPAVPLVACDPYFSIWSPADKLTDAETTHWTGKPHRLRSALRVDGEVYRVMGRGSAEEPELGLTQKSLTVLPTRTIYTFEERVWR